ncbi:hypothetical protein [Chitinimonas sp.]|uniref:hypothetical protein n=1 Tax=Chitinimonas sp. TaxID=1934313 RepID=UPI0035B1EDCE
MLDFNFAKTSKGRDEVATRAHRLGMRHRQALIVLDGATPARNLLKILGDEATTIRIVNELLAGEFIATTHDAALSSGTAGKAIEAVENAAPAPPEFEPVQPSAADPIDSHPSSASEVLVTPSGDQTRLEGVRIIMLNTTEQYLGLMGADLAKRIAAAQDAAALRAMVPRWHMALRESRKGRDSAERYLDSVMATLGQ